MKVRKLGRWKKEVNSVRCNCLSPAETHSKTHWYKQKSPQLLPGLWSCAKSRKEQLGKGWTEAMDGESYRQLFRSCVQKAGPVSASGCGSSTWALYQCSSNRILCGFHAKIAFLITQEAHFSQSSHHYQAIHYGVYRKAFSPLIFTFPCSLALTSKSEFSFHRLYCMHY